MEYIMDMTFLWSRGSSVSSCPSPLSLMYGRRLQKPFVRKGVHQIQFGIWKGKAQRGDVGIRVGFERSKCPVVASCESVGGLMHCSCMRSSGRDNLPQTRFGAES